MAVFDAFGTLNPYQRRLLVLRHHRGWSYAQIAALEGATLDAVKSALKRGRYAFRRAYSAIATERGLSVLTWPVVGRAVRRVRSLRDWARGEIASGVQLGRALNIPLDTAASLVLATVVAGALIVGGIRGLSVDEDPPPAPVGGLATASVEAALAVPVEGVGSAEVGGTAAASVGWAPSGGVATGAPVETVATPPGDTGTYAGGTKSGGGTYTAASASLSAPPVASEDPAASVEATGEVEKDNPDMRRVRVSYDRKVDGQGAPLKGTGHASADVPCNYFGPEQHACDAIDTVTEEAPPAGSDPPPAEWGPPPESEAEPEPAESEAEPEPAESEAESEPAESEPEPSPDPDE